MLEKDLIPLDHQRILQIYEDIKLSGLFNDLLKKTSRYIKYCYLIKNHVKVIPHHFLHFLLRKNYQMITYNGSVSRNSLRRELQLHKNYIIGINYENYSLYTP